jgi:ABC-2 type transport system permease protein
MEPAMPDVSAAVIGLPAPAHARRVSVARAYALEARYEFLKLARLPHFSAPTIGFPVMFYLLFGLSFAKGEHAAEIARYLLAGYSMFGLVTASLFAFGAGVAMERAQGWLSLKRATPMPVGAYLLAKVAASMVFGTVILVLMAACAIGLAHVRLPLTAWLDLWAVMMLGCVPFCLMGLMLAFLVPPTGAPAIVNLVNLPLAFAGGFWMPLENLPAMFQAIAPFVPQYHLCQLALAAVGVSSDPRTGQHVAALVVYTLVFGVLAWVAYLRSDAREG